MVTKLAPKRLFVMEIENVNCGCNNTVIKKDIELTKSVAYIYSSNYVKVCDQGYKVTSRVRQDISFYSYVASLYVLKLVHY